MISNEELEQAKAQLLSGQISLRQLSIRMNIDRDALKNMIKGICTPEEQQSLEEVLLDNKVSNVVELNEDVKEIIIQILKGEISARQASEKYGIDRETLRRKAEELANSSPEYIQYYIKYKSKRGDFSGINFRRLFVEMIENGMSQTEIAEQYEIPTRTMSRELEKIGKSADEYDEKLYNIAKIYAEKMMRRQTFTEYEKRLYHKILNEIKENSQFISIDSEPVEEKRFKELQEFKKEVKVLEKQGMTKQQIATKLGVGVSTIRRRLLELEEQEGLRKKKSPADPDEPDGRE